MTDLSLVHPVTPGTRATVAQLHREVERADGHPSLNETMWHDLDHPSPETAGVLATDDTGVVGYLHVAPVLPEWSLGLVVRPERRGDGVARELLGRGRDWIDARGGGEAVLWVLAPDERTDVEILAAGFHRQRDLLQQRVALPLDAVAEWPDGITVRSFVPGRDEEQWLAVNNRAFRTHPEQGGWELATLQERMAEPWFDPGGFVLAFADDDLVGFCWTKVHAPGPGEPEPLGEIYVIGVDPSSHSRGLGRALTVAGLDSLASRGVKTGMLFVDGANEPALGLYRSLGFETWRHDRAYAQEIPAS